MHNDQKTVLDFGMMLHFKSALFYKKNLFCNIILNRDTHAQKKVLC